VGKRADCLRGDSGLALAYPYGLPPIAFILLSLIRGPRTNSSRFNRL
jgi:hypothetical protein